MGKGFGERDSKCAGKVVVTGAGVGIAWPRLTLRRPVASWSGARVSMAAMTSATRRLASR